MQGTPVKQPLTFPTELTQLSATVGSNRLASSGFLGICLSAAFLHLPHPLLELCFHLRHSRCIALIAIGALAALEDGTRLLDLLLQRGPRLEYVHGGASEDNKRVEFGRLFADLHR